MPTLEVPPANIPKISKSQADAVVVLGDYKIVFDPVFNNLKIDAGNKTAQSDVLQALHDLRIPVNSFTDEDAIIRAGRSEKQDGYTSGRKLQGYGLAVEGLSKPAKMQAAGAQVQSSEGRDRVTAV